MSKFLIAFSVLILISVNGFSINYTWIGTTNTLWNTPSNWSPAGIPGAADNVTINNGALANQPLMPSNKTVTNFTISAGTLNLGGFILTVTGNSTCSGGILNTGTFTPNTAAGTITFSGTTFNSQVNATAANLFFNGGIFNGAVNSFTQTGTTGNNSNGGCTFAGVSSNTVSNTGTGSIKLGNITPDIFNGPLFLNNSSTGHIQIGYLSLNNQLNQNVVVSSTGTGSIGFGNIPGSSCTLAAGKTILAIGFSSGTLLLANFIQIGATPQIISLSGTADFMTQNGCIINGSLTVTSPIIMLHGGIFNGAVNQFTTTGSGVSNGTGGCTFAGTTSNTFTNAGTGEWRLAQDNPDIYNGPTFFTISNSGIITVAPNSLNNQFNENVVVSSTGSGTIRFGYSFGTCLLAANKTITASTFSSGTLYLKNFTQIGVTAQNINLTGTASLDLNTGTTFNGSLSSVAPKIFFNGAIFNGATNQFTQTGSFLTISDGGCTFAGATSNAITNTSTGEIRMGNVNPDIFNGPITFNNSSSGTINIGYNSVNNQFNQNITLTSTGLGSIQMSQGTGTSILAIGKTISTPIFTSGVLRLRNFTQNGTTAQNITTTGTSILLFETGTTINGSLTTSAPNLRFNGSTFNGAINEFTQTGTVLNLSIGGCTFAGATSNTITNSGTGEIRMGNTNPDIFNGPAVFNNSSSGTINVGYNSLNNQFNQNITLTSSGLGSIRFGQSTGTSILATGKTITTSTFTAGSLYLRNFTQTGVFLQNITTTGTASIYYETGTTFNGPLTSSSPNLFFNGSTFNGGSNLFTQTGTLVNTSIGGCTFGGFASNWITNSGTGEIRMANSNADIFNGPARFNNNSSGTINVGYNSLNNQFNQSIIITSTGTGSINFSQGTGTSILASGKTITNGTFSSGNLRLRNFTQTSATAQNITTTGTSSLYFQTGTTFNGTITTSSPNLFLDGSTFYGTGNQFTQTGTNTNSSLGGNTFAGSFSNIINNTGTGEIRLATINPDIFSALTNLFNNTSTGTINVAYSSSNNQFNGDIHLSANNIGTIAFGQGGGNCSLQSGEYINSAAVASGSLRFRNFTQTGNSSPQTLNLIGTATIFFETGTTFNSNVICQAPNIYLNGSTFNGTSKLTKFAGVNNLSIGGNLFNGTSEIINSSNVDFQLGGTNPDIFNGTSSKFTNTGSGYFDVAYSSIGTTFNSSNIIVSSITSSGIYFGFGGGTTIIDNSDFTSPIYDTGALVLMNVTYNSGAGPNQNITITGSASFQTSYSIYNVELNVTAPSLQLSNSAFNQDASFIKTGSSIDFSDGGNIFNGVASFENQSLIGELYEGTTFNDFYYADVHYSGVGEIHPAYNGTTFYYQDIYTTPLTFFGTGGGTVSLSGFVDQTFYSDYISPTSISYLDIQSSSTCFFDGKTQIITKVQFISGYVDATETEPLTLTETAIISSPATDASHSIGYIQKIGDTSFDFPVGNGTYLMPISISAPANITDAFTANYVDTSSHTLYSHFLKEPSIDHISDCHYWNLNRDAGSSDVFVTVNWNNAYNLCEVTDPSDLIVAHWNSGTTIWEDYGNGGTSGTAAAGSITTSMPVNNFSPITLASFGGINVLPIELTSFNAVAKIDFVELKWITASELNNDYFTIERSFDGINFEPIATVNSKAESGNSSQELEYTLIDDDQLEGLIYYRLKQTDFDGAFEYSDIVNVIINNESNDMMIQPNPNNGAFNLMFSSSNLGEGTIQIYSSNGEKVRTEIVPVADGTQTKWIDFSDLPKGVYILKFYTKDKVTSEKLVVN